MTLRDKQINDFANLQADGKFFNVDLYTGITIGAKWADKNPKPGTVNKQEFIKKACKWLQENLSEGYDSDNYPMIRCYDIDMEDFIKEFSREMEE